MHHESPSLRAPAPQLDCDALAPAGGATSLVVVTSLRLALEHIENLKATHRRRGVTSNYRFDLAPHTQSLNRPTRTAWNAPRTKNASAGH